MEADGEDFARFVDLRQRALLRSGWLLTGDWALAEDLVQTALARTWLRWGRIRSRDDPEIYVRRVMLSTWVNWSRGSEVAAEVLRPGPSGGLPTNAVPAGIFVINTATGAKAFWHTGPYIPGALQYADAQDISFTRNGGELVVLQARCHRNHSLAECNGNADIQARAYNPADRGGSLEAGKILLNQSALKPHGTRLSDAFISPDGSALTSLLMTCPRHGSCALSVVRISVATGRTVRVLYRVHTGTAFRGVFERFFSSDPSGRYLILDAGAGRARVNGWIDHGKLVPLTPPDGNAPIYETW